MSADVLLARLDGVRQTGSGVWIALCPAHGDRHPSLGVRETSDGRVLVFCRAGCGTHDIIAAAGIEWSDLFPERLGDHLPPVRPRFPADAMLALLDNEAAIASVAADNLAAGMALTDDDRKRLRLASIRISRAREIAHGH